MGIGGAYGVQCTRCGYTAEVIVQEGDPSKCSKCGGPLMPNPAANIFVNMTCSNCRTHVSLALEPACPTCGTPWKT